jgi:hypothetical protein
LHLNVAIVAFDRHGELIFLCVQARVLPKRLVFPAARTPDDRNAKFGAVVVNASIFCSTASAVTVPRAQYNWMHAAVCSDTQCAPATASVHVRHALRIVCPCICVACIEKVILYSSLNYVRFRSPAVLPFPSLVLMHLLVIRALVDVST